MRRVTAAAGMCITAWALPAPPGSPACSEQIPTQALSLPAWISPPALCLGTPGLLISWPFSLSPDITHSWIWKERTLWLALGPVCMPLWSMCPSGPLPQLAWNPRAGPQGGPSNANRASRSGRPSRGPSQSVSAPRGACFVWYHRIRFEVLPDSGGPLDLSVPCLLHESPLPGVPKADG